jgi:hypothetical protein
MLKQKRGARDPEIAALPAGRAASRRRARWVKDETSPIGLPELNELLASNDE